MTKQRKLDYGMIAAECGNQIIVTFDGDFGSWTPESAADVAECAAGYTRGLELE